MRLAKFIIFLGLVIGMVACNTQTGLEENQGNENITGSEQPQPTEAIKELKKPIDLKANQILIIKNQLYFYNESQDSIKLVVLDDGVGLAIVSPSKKYLAVTKGQDTLLIVNNNMIIEKEFNLHDLEEQDFIGVGDLRWIGEDRLLVGLDYNANVRGYYVIELNQEQLSVSRIALTKTGQGVIEVLDLTGEHILYQQPNERSFSETDKPAIYLDNQLIYQASKQTSLIGKISVNTIKQQVIFPVTNGSQTMFVIGQYDITKNKLDHIEQYAVDFAENEQLLDYVLDTSLQEGYVFSQREAERRLYKWKLNELPTLVFLATLPESIHLSKIVLTDELRLEIYSAGRAYEYMEIENVFEERMKEVREYLIKKSKQDIDTAITEEQITLIENF